MMQSCSFTIQVDPLGEIPPLTSSKPFLPPLCKQCHSTKREDLITNLRLQLERQQEYLPHPEFMDKIQKDPMAPMWRRRIVEWMVKAAKEFDMHTDTVACAVNYMDRYLSEFQADKLLLQLLAMVSLCVASKMHESQPLTMEEMRLLSHNLFSRNDIRDVEKQLLDIVNWKLNPPTPYTFARGLISLIDDVDVREALLNNVLQILDHCLQDHTFLQYSYSTIALASILLACSRRNLPVNPWIRWGINTLGWPHDGVRECQSAILATLPQMLSPMGSDSRSSKLPKSRAESPTSTDELEEMLSAEDSADIAVNLMSDQMPVSESFPIRGVSSHNSNKRMRVEQHWS